MFVVEHNFPIRKALERPGDRAGLTTRRLTVEKLERALRDQSTIAARAAASLQSFTLARSYTALIAMAPPSQASSSAARGTKRKRPATTSTRPPVKRETPEELIGKKLVREPFRDIREPSTGCMC